MKPKQELLIRVGFTPTGWLTNHRYTQTTWLQFAFKGRVGDACFRTQALPCMGTPNSDPGVWTPSQGDLHVGKEAGAGNV